MPTMLLLHVAFFTALVLSAAGLSTEPAQVTDRYNSVFIDAGSSGSRVFVFEAFFDERLKLC